MVCILHIEEKLETAFHEQLHLHLLLCSIHSKLEYENKTQ